MHWTVLYKRARLWSASGREFGGQVAGDLDVPRPPPARCWYRDDLGDWRGVAIVHCRDRDGYRGKPMIRRRETLGWRSRSDHRAVVSATVKQTLVVAMLPERV